MTYQDPMAAMSGAAVPGLRTTGLGRALCLGGAGLGALGLLGWLTGERALVTIIPGQPPMMPNTGLALLLVGVAGALRYPGDSGHRVQRSLSVLAAMVVLALGLGTIAEYAVGLPFSLDQLLVYSEVGPYPGRPSPPTALALAFLAAAILFWEWRPTGRVRPWEWLILCAGLIAFTALLGQAFGAGALYELIRTPIIGVAVHTALSLLIISVGLILQRPDAGIIRVATSSGPGGVLLRRLAPVAVLVPVLFGLTAAWLLAVPNVEDVSLVFAALIVISGTVSLLLLTTTAEHLNHTHDALEQSRARKRDLIELASDGIFIADIEGRYVDVNNAGCRMLGYSREEILGKTILDLIPPGDQARLWSDRELFLKGGSSVSEWTLLRKDGTYLPVEVSAKILPDGRWQGFVRDISERKRVEDALRQAQERFDLALKGADLATWDWNVKTGEVIFNPRWAEMRGFSPEEIGPHVESWSAGVHADDWPAVQKVLSDCFEGVHPEFECEYRVSTKSGEWIWVLDRGKIFARDEQGQPTRMVGTELDVTARKRAETEQRLLAEVGEVLAVTLELEDTLTNIARLIVRDLADYCIVDVVEDDGSIRRARVVCRDPSKAWVCDALMRTPLDGEQPPLAGPVLETRQGHIVQKVTPDVICSWARNEEERTALQSGGLQSAIATPLLAHGKLLGALVLMSETASRAYGPADLRMVEAIAQRAAFSLDNARLYRAAKRATQARDDMLGIVAHDLRNPLAAIATLATVLRTNGIERELGEDIGKAANRMNRLIQDLLDVTRMEAGRLALRRTRVMVGEIISDSLEAQMPLASSASLELSRDVARDLPDIWADHDRLLQVFENLIGNAIKFTKPGGRITVGAMARAGEVLFSVGDTGCGIASTHLPHVFDRFWQAPKATRRGAGLGLPIVKGIVEAHGGRVWVQSSPGRGSTFFFTIPAAPQAGAPQPISKAAHSRNRRTLDVAKGSDSKSAH